MKLSSSALVTPDVFKLSMPLNRMAATMALTPTASGPTGGNFKADYEMKFGALGWLRNAIMIGAKMSGMFNTVLAGLAHHVTVGELIQMGWRPPPARVAAAAAR